MSTPSVSTPPPDSNAYLNDTLTTQAHHKAGETTASGLTLSGSVVLESEAQASQPSGATRTGFLPSDWVPTFSETSSDPSELLPYFQQAQGDATSIMQQANSMYAYGMSALQQIQESPALMQNFVANLIWASQNDPSTQNLFKLTRQYLATLPQSEVETQSQNNATSDATTASSSTGETSETSTTTSTTTSSSSTTTTDDVATESDSSTTNEVSSDGDTTGGAGGSTDETGINSISISAMLDDVETLMNDLNEVTEEAQQASITQNLCEVSQQIAAALETGDSGLGPLNAAWTSMFMSAGACALTMGGMGYSSYSADQAEEEQQTLSNEQLQNSTHGLSESSDNVVEQAQNDTLTDESITKLQANTSAAKAAASHSSVAATAAEDTKSAATESEGLARVTKVKRAQQELESALKEAQKTTPPTQAQLLRIEKASGSLNRAADDLRPEDGGGRGRQIQDSAKGLAARAGAINPDSTRMARTDATSMEDNRAIVAAKKAQGSTQDAINNPRDMAKQKQAQDDLTDARVAARGKDVTPSVQASIERAMAHGNRALYHAGYMKGGPNAGRADYDPELDDAGESSHTPQMATATNLDKMNTAIEDSKTVSATEVQKQIQDILRGGELNQCKNLSLDGMKYSAAKVRSYSEFSKENSDFFNDNEGGGFKVEGYRPTYSRSGRIAATKRVNTEVQKLAAASKKYQENPTPENGKALNAQRETTEDIINKPENASAHSAVKANGRQAVATSDPDNVYDNDATQQAASKSRTVTANTERKKTTGLSQNYQGHFQNVFGWFSAINMMNSSVGALITAKGNMSSKLDEQQAGIDQAAGSAYGEGLTLSNQNAQLLESILASLESTYSQMSQSQTQDVSFVRGAN